MSPVYRTVLCASTLLLFVPLLGIAQQLSLEVASTSTSPGQQTVLALTLTSEAGSEPAGLQWTLHYPAAQLNLVETTIGGVASSAGKSIRCHSGTSGQTTCLLIGSGSSTIPNGTVAEVRFSVAGNATGTPPVTLTDGIAAFAQGSPAEPPPGLTPGTITIVPSQISCDLNGDGLVNVVDAQLGVNQSLGVAACVTADLDQNGVCNVIDLQRLVNAALGLACLVGS